MSAVTLHLAMSWAARLSAVLFALSLLLPTLSPQLMARPQRLHIAFIVAHTLHFSVVAWLASVTGGAGMFPGGRSVAQVGGWPVVFAIFGLFYALAFISLAARRFGAAQPRLRTAGKLSTTFIGFMFVATYLPLIARSGWYAFLALLVAAAVATDLRAHARASPRPARLGAAP